MASLNQCTLIGNLGADPEIRSMQNGNKVANLRIATSESWKDRDGNKQERTEWHQIVCFSDGLVSVIERYLKKGSKVMVQGKLQTRKWQDQNGQDRYSTEVVLQGFDAKLVMLDAPSDNRGERKRGYEDQNDGWQGQKPSGGADYSDLDDEIPGWN